MSAARVLHRLFSNSVPFIYAIRLKDFTVVVESIVHGARVCNITWSLTGWRDL